MTDPKTRDVMERLAACDRAADRLIAERDTLLARVAELEAEVGALKAEKQANTIHFTLPEAMGPDPKPPIKLRAPKGTHR